MARQGRCVAEAGVRDAASRIASKHAEAWVCPPALFPWPPLGSDSLSSVPPPLPGFRSWRADSGRRAGPQAGCGGWGQSGATRRRDRSPPAGRPAGVHVDAVDVVRAAGYRPLRGLPLYRGSTAGRRSRRRFLGAGPARGVSPASSASGRPDTAALGRRAKSRGSRACRPRACRPRACRPPRSGTTSRSRSEKLDGQLAGSVIGTEPRSRYLPNLPWQEGVFRPSSGPGGRHRVGRSPVASTVAGERRGNVRLRG